MVACATCHDTREPNFTDQRRGERSTNSTKGLKYAARRPDLPELPQFANDYNTLKRADGQRAGLQPEHAAVRPVPRPAIPRLSEWQPRRHDRPLGFETRPARAQHTAPIATIRIIPKYPLVMPVFPPKPVIGEAIPAGASKPIPLTHSRYSHGKPTTQAEAAAEAADVTATRAARATPPGATCSRPPASLSAPPPSPRRSPRSPTGAARIYRSMISSSSTIANSTRNNSPQVLKHLEEDTKKNYGAEVTISDHRPQKGVKFGYALNLSICIGCRRCAEACHHENNHDRATGNSYIRVLEMQKGSMDHRTRQRPLRSPGAAPGQVLHAGAVPAVRQPALRACLPGRGDLEGGRRHRGRRLQLVHRLPVLRGRLPVSRPAFQLDQAGDSQGGDQSEPILPQQPHPAAGRDGKMHLLPAPHARRDECPPASKPARPARASSATCWIRIPRSARSSTTSACSSSRRNWAPDPASSTSSTSDPPTPMNPTISNSRRCRARREVPRRPAI